MESYNIAELENEKFYLIMKDQAVLTAVNSSSSYYSINSFQAGSVRNWNGETVQYEYVDAAPKYIMVHIHCPSTKLSYIFVRKN